MEKGELKRRFFIAVFPPKSVVKKLAPLRGCGARDWEWKWPADYHISLAFPGPLTEKRLEKLKKVLANVRHSPFDIKLDKVSYFLGNDKKDNKRNPHVLLAEPAIASAAALKSLHAAIAGPLRVAGFKTGKCNYAPHLTLAKIQKKDVDLMKDFAAAHDGLTVQSWRCNRFAIYESLERTDRAHPANNNGKGSKFRKVAEFGLAA